MLKSARRIIRESSLNRYDIVGRFSRYDKWQLDSLYDIDSAHFEHENSMLAKCEEAEGAWSQEALASRDNYPSPLRASSSRTVEFLITSYSIRDYSGLKSPSGSLSGCPASGYDCKSHSVRTIKARSFIHSIRGGFPVQILDFNSFSMRAAQGSHVLRIVRFILVGKN